MDVFAWLDIMIMGKIFVLHVVLNVKHVNKQRLNVLLVELMIIII